RIQRPTPWTKIRIEPTASSHDGAEYATIGLHLEPTKRADVRGSASFADLWVGRLPRMSLKSDRRDNGYVDPARPELPCTASGFADDNAQVVFELLDRKGQTICTHRQQLTISTPPGTLRTEGAPSAGQRAAGIVGTASWTPPVPDMGYYRVRAAMLGRSGKIH